MSTYNTHRNRAQARGWPAPLLGSDMDTHPTWRESWVRYWHAMARYEELKASDPNGDHGRPVQPHRSGGGVPAQGVS